MRYTNAEMDDMLESLGPLMEQRNMVGYAAARNARILDNELTEYHRMRDELIIQMGEPETDEDGNQTGRSSIQIGTPAFIEFAKEMERYAAIEHEPDLYKIKYEEAIGNLSGAELLAADWMFED